MLAFFLYNLEREDRAIMAQSVPTPNLLLQLFKPWWKSMVPFLLVDG
jgi:hypothetical protein